MKMKLDYTWQIGYIATITSLLANGHVREKFNTTYPYIYWGFQIVFCSAFS